MRIDTKEFRVRPGEKINLKDWPTEVKPFYQSKTGHVPGEDSCSDAEVGFRVFEVLFTPDVRVDLSEADGAEAIFRVRVAGRFNKHKPRK